MMRPPGLSFPSRSAASIMALPIRSFTLNSGLKNSAFTQTSASRPAVRWLRRISGVLPTVATMFSAMFMGIC